MCVPEAADDGHGVAAGTWLAGLGTVLREWGRIGIIGFGGPPAHIALLRRLCVQDREWLDAAEFEDAIAACNLLPGPASTELAIFCAWRVRGRAGAVAGGLAFIVPGLIIILLLSALFLAGAPPSARSSARPSCWPRVLSVGWQFAVLAGAAVLLLALRRGVVLTLFSAAAVGLIVAFAGGPLPR